MAKVELTRPETNVEKQWPSRRASQTSCARNDRSPFVDRSTRSSGNCSSCLSSADSSLNARTRAWFGRFARRGISSVNDWASPLTLRFLAASGAATTVEFDSLICSVEFQSPKERKIASFSDNPWTTRDWRNVAANRFKYVPNSCNVS